jgi:hypothetical protein
MVEFTFKEMISIEYVYMLILRNSNRCKVLLIVKNNSKIKNREKKNSQLSHPINFCFYFLFLKNKLARTGSKYSDDKGIIQIYKKCFVF